MEADLLTQVSKATTRVMSCSASVIVVGGWFDAHAVVGRLHQLESRWSRFIESSEISVVNRAEGAAVTVSEDTARLVAAAVQAWHLTDGDFDPTLAPTLVALGYDTSRDDPGLACRLGSGLADRGEPADILVDTVSGVVQLPVGTALDPGGIGKGLAADLLCAEVIECGAGGALVEIGGDLRVIGAALGATPWTIAIDAPGAAGRHLIELSDGGVATSTTMLRRWDGPTGERHHLIDPATLTPTETSVATCTVVAGNAAMAEAFTKVAFVAGRAAAIDRYEARGLAALVIEIDGTEHRTTAWKTLER